MRSAQAEFLAAQAIDRVMLYGESRITHVDETNRVQRAVTAEARRRKVGGVTTYALDDDSGTVVVLQSPEHYAPAAGEWAAWHREAELRQMASGDEAEADDNHDVDARYERHRISPSSLSIELTADRIIDLRRAAEPRPWWVTLKNLGDHSEHAITHAPTVATATLWTIDPGMCLGGSDPGGALDEESADLAPFAVLFDEHGMLNESLHGLIGLSPIIVDDVRVDPACRGMGYGPWLVAEALHELGLGYSLAAVLALPSEVAPDDPGRPVAIRQVERLWERFGFEVYDEEDAVWVLPLDARTLSETLAALRRAVGLDEAADEVDALLANDDDFDDDDDSDDVDADDEVVEIDLNDPAISTVGLTSRGDGDDLVGRYMAHGARTRVHGLAWFLRDQVDAGWGLIAEQLNTQHVRHPQGRRWTYQFARSYFGEPVWHVGDGD